MNDEVAIKDPKAKGKKKAVTIAVAILGVLVIVVFIVFGQLLRGFLVFDANRIEAIDELTELKSRIIEREELLSIRKSDFELQISGKKNQLQQLEDSISKRDAQIASQQKLIDECATLSERVSSIQRDYQLALDGLESVSKSIATQEGTVSALKIEMAALLSRKSSLQGEVSRFDQTKENAEQVVAQLANKIKVLGQEKSATQTEVSLVQQGLIDASTRLTNLNVKITNARKLSAQLMEENRKSMTTNDMLSAQVILMKEAVKTKVSEKNKLVETVSGLSQKATRLSAQIPALDERKHLVETQLIMAEKKVEQADARLQSINHQIEASLAQLLQINNVPNTEIKTTSLPISKNSPNE